MKLYHSDEAKDDNLVVPNFRANFRLNFGGQIFIWILDFGYFLLPPLSDFGLRSITGSGFRVQITGPDYRGLSDFGLGWTRDQDSILMG